MAKIEFEAFIEAWTKNTDQHPAWGMKTAETHSRKNEDGKYETSGRTFRTVKVSRASGVDLTQYVKGSRVKVTGTEQTETREHEGKKFYDLIVWADRVELVQGQQATTAPPAASQAPAEEWSQPNTFDGQVPF
jgi:single-stranded DNA-binding protein